MSVINPKGSQVYWFNGEPYKGQSSGNYSDISKFWFNGESYSYLMPTAYLGNFFMVF